MEQSVLERKDGGGEYYTVKGAYGTKKFPTMRVDEYNVTIVDGIRNLYDWGIDKNKMFPKQYIAEIGMPIALIISERDEANNKDKIVAKSLGLGFTGGRSHDKEIINGEVVISRIINKDGSIRDLADGEKVKYVIENRERTVGEGDKKTELYIVLNDKDAKHLVDTVIRNKNAVINSPELREEKQQKFPVLDVPPEENKIPYPIRVPSDPKESSILVPNK